MQKGSIGGGNEWRGMGTTEKGVVVLGTLGFLGRELRLLTLFPDPLMIHEGPCHLPFSSTESWRVSHFTTSQQFNSFSPFPTVTYTIPTPLTNGLYLEVRPNTRTGLQHLFSWIKNAKYSADDTLTAHVKEFELAATIREQPLILWDAGSFIYNFHSTLHAF